MEIRRAKPEDARAMSRVNALSWKAAYRGMVPQDYLDGLREDFWVPAFSSWLEQGTFSAQLLLEAGRVTGCACYGAARDPARPGWGEIVSLYLLPGSFGKGLGAALLEKVLEDLGARTFPNVYLWVLEENLRARRFYERHGFAPTGEACRDGGTGRLLTDLRYVLRR